MFVLSTALHSIAVFIGALLAIIQAANQPKDGFSNSEKGFMVAISENPFAMGILCYTFMIGCCLGSFSGYHLQLIFSDTTTNEQIKGYMDGRGSSSGITNCYNLFCRPVPSSLINLHDRVDPDMFMNSTLEKQVVHSDGALITPNGDSDTEDII
jgi:hypothetical protein